jgi:hypothetical protein
MAMGSWLRLQSPPASVRLLRAGDTVDVLAAGAGADGSGTARGLSWGGAGPRSTSERLPLGAGDIDPGALVVVVTSPETAAPPLP